LKGEKVRSQKLKPVYHWYLSTEPSGDYSKIYLMNNKGDILTLDEKLHTIYQKSVKIPVIDFKLTVDLNQDLVNEYIFGDAGGYSIVTQDFRTVTHAGIGARGMYDIVTVRKNGSLPPQLAVFTNGKTYLVDYQDNPYYPLRYLFFIAFWILIFGILWSSLLLLRMLLLYNCFWKFLFQYSSHGIALMDYKGRITNLNAMLEHHLGMRHHIQNKERYEVAFAERPEILSILNRFFKNPQPIEESLSFSTTTGSFKGIIHVYPLVGPWRIPLGYSLEITDHSQTVMEERMQVWSKTVQKMAHDIKTPLSTVQLSLQTLQMKLFDLTPQSMSKVEKDFQFILNELQRIRNITRDFLKFTNLEQPNFQVVTLSDIIEKALDRFKSYLNGNLQVQKELDLKHDQLWADPQQLEMVFKIIIENAIDAMQGKGIILISTNLAQYLDKSFKEFIEIDIADTGCGIGKEHKDKIFEPYFTTKPDGTGMGLSIAQKIIKDHGGEITITTREHFATVVRIMLPMGNIREESDASNSGN
jgi:signal transduction histidine kinase